MFTKLSFCQPRREAALPPLPLAVLTAPTPDADARAPDTETALAHAAHSRKMWKEGGVDGLES